MVFEELGSKVNYREGVFSKISFILTVINKLNCGYFFFFFVEFCQELYFMFNEYLFNSYVFPYDFLKFSVIIVATVFLFLR